MQSRLSKPTVDLFNQQLWCWGRDVVRPEGNWLIESGFTRLKPPETLLKCASLYTLNLPEDRRVILRGFGVFYGDDRYGGLFVRRGDRQLRYTQEATLNCLPWSERDLPSLKVPSTSQHTTCSLLLLGLTRWIQSYEEKVQTELGLEYRRSTVASWDNGRRPITAAEKMVDAWESLEELYKEHRLAS